MRGRLTRREFAKAVGASLTTYPLFRLTACTGQTTGSTEGTTALEDRYVPSVCLQCPGGCGILVRTVGGRAVKIEGNPLYPSNRGGTCPKGQMGLQILYDPDRIKGPMRQTRRRGDVEGFRAISWDEAIDLLSVKLRALREAGEAHTLVMMGGRYRGQMGDLFARFCNAFGTPNNVVHSSICEDGSPMAHWLAQGWMSYAAYDWDHCEYVISFGGEMLEAWRPTARLLRAWGEMHRGGTRGRVKFVQVEPRFSVTAAKADQWLPVNPGTDAALALGMAHVIVRERRYDEEFVRKHTFGFDDWQDEHGRPHRGFKSYLLTDWGPDKAASVCGIAVETIESVAREFAAKAPHCIAAGARGTSMQSNGIFTRFAIHALNGLVGSIDRRGGILRQVDPPLTPWPATVADDWAKQGLAHERLDRAGTVHYPLAGKVYQDVPDRILEGTPYPVKMLLCYYTNPLFSSPDIGRWTGAIEKIPFVASFSPFLDETTAHADLVLPDHTYLERWHDDVIYPSMGYPVVGIRQPVITPLFDTRNTADVLLQLARKIGGGVADSFPWTDMEEVLKFRCRGLFEAKTGNIAADRFDQWWQSFCEAGVWTAPPYPFAEENPEQWKRVLVSETAEGAGKFQFYSQNLASKLAHLAAEEADGGQSSTEEQLESMLTGLQLTARGDVLYLPHYEPVRYVGDPGEFPFVLITYKTLTHAEGRGANTPLAQERFAVQTGETWTACAQMNPQTAASLGLGENDEIWVESPLGKLRTRLKLLPHHPGALVMPFELGHRHYGRYAERRGTNPNTIIANVNDRLGGLAAWFSTRVRVTKA